MCVCLCVCRQGTKVFYSPSLRLSRVTRGADGYDGQGWRIKGFEGARAPPEREGAPSHCQKHPLKTKEKVIKHHLKPISHKDIVIKT